MNKHDIDKLVRWSVDSDLKKFAEDAYGVTGTDFDVASNGEYLRDKFRQMQTHFIMWISGLDNKNRIRLARNISFNQKEENKMGMDVHGLNPKMNKGKEKYKTYFKWDNIDWRERSGAKKEEWEKEQDKFYSEMSSYQDDNRGTYFRNSCWWWRPLWDYCRHVAPELISDQLWESGHHNDGSGLNAEKAKMLGEILMENIADGSTMSYEKTYNDLAKNDEHSYPFDVNNVENFALFCIESGGFEIC